MSEMHQLALDNDRWRGEAEALRAQVQKLPSIVHAIGDALAYSDNIGRRIDNEWVDQDAVYYRYEDTLALVRDALLAIMRQCGVEREV